MPLAPHPYLTNWRTSLAGVLGAAIILLSGDVHDPSTWGKALTALLGGLAAADGGRPSA